MEKNGPFVGPGAGAGLVEPGGGDGARKFHWEASLRFWGKKRKSSVAVQKPAG